MRTIAIGNRIKLLRIRRCLTQGQLALALGVTPQAVSRWEVGRSYPDLELLPVIAAYFAVSTDFLLGLEQRGT